MPKVVQKLHSTFCRMQNAECRTGCMVSGISVRQSVTRARSLARSEIDKDRTFLVIAFQVYKSENNKVKRNKSRLP